MDPLLKKMNYKDESMILCVGIPCELKERFKQFQETVDTKTSYQDMDLISFAIIFVLNQKDIEEGVEAIKEKLSKDAKVWFAYPKKSSKNIKVRLTEIMDGKL